MTARIDPDGFDKVAAHLKAAEEAVKAARAALADVYDMAAIDGIDTARAELDMAGWAYAGAIFHDEEATR